MHKKCLFLIAICCFSYCWTLAQNTRKIDSLAFSLSQNTNKQDTNTVVVLGELARLYNNNLSFDSALYYAQATLNLSQKLNYTIGIAKGYEEIARAHSLQSNYVQAIRFFFEALKIYERFNNQKMSADILAAISFNYKLQENYAQALEFENKALILSKSINNVAQQISSLTQIADIHLRLAQYDEALKYANLCLEIMADKKDNRPQATIFNILGTIQRNKGKIDEAISLHLKALEMYEKTNIKLARAVTWYNLALAYEEKKDWDNAQKYAQQALELGKILKIKETIRNNSNVLYRVAKQKGDYQASLNYLELHTAIKDSLFSIEKTKAVNNLKNNYELESKEKEIALLNKDKQIQSVYNRALIISFLLVLALALVMFVGYGQKQKANRLLQQKNTEIQRANDEITLQHEELQQKQEEILTQRDFIEKKNKELEYKNFKIESNIRAAQGIHDAILPSAERLKEMLNEYFLIYLPRDVVSGDFYYIFKEKDFKLIAIADCLGHGVQGAFMSLIGYGVLDRLVRTQGMSDPAQILNELDASIRLFFERSNNYRASTMDFALLTIHANSDGKTQKIRFEGAKRNLHYINHSLSKELKEITGTRKAIGGAIRPYNEFVTKELDLPIGTTIYLGSDGYTDQNDTQRKKFGKQNFIELIVENAHLSLTKQKEILENRLYQFMEGTEQRDDILLLGFKI
jgi:serine phosphatase RsbU (regulator of sigma subunit)